MCHKTLKDSPDLSFWSSTKPLKPYVGSAFSNIGLRPFAFPVRTAVTVLDQKSCLLPPAPRRRGRPPKRCGPVHSRPPPAPLCCPHITPGHCAAALAPGRRGCGPIRPFAPWRVGARGGPGSGPGGSERRVRVADSIPMAQGHRGRGGARVGGVGADFGSAPPRAAACASGGLGYREGESRGGARSFCDRRGWVRCAAPPIFRASGAREVALILLSYAQTPFSVGLIARSPQFSARVSLSHAPLRAKCAAWIVLALQVENRHNKTSSENVPQLPAAFGTRSSSRRL